MADQSVERRASFAQGTLTPGNNYYASTNQRGATFLTNPKDPYPIVTGRGGVPSNRRPDPNLKIDDDFWDKYDSNDRRGGRINQRNQKRTGGKLRKHRKTKKGSRRHKSRKHHKKSSRRYHR